VIRKYRPPFRPAAWVPVLLVAVLTAAALGRAGLLDHPRAHAETRTNAPKKPVDNSMCNICHLDLEDETLVVIHLKHKVTCQECHGPSMHHVNDEMAATKPDILFGRAEVEPFCKKCHPKEHKNPEAVAAFREQWRGKQRPSGRAIADHSICTDCHGQHVLPKAAMPSGGGR
jgi:hypothetical protein